MHSTTLLGVYVDCDTAVCADCHDPSTWEGFEDWDEPLAIFPDSEADTPNHCAQCHALIPHALTGDGLAYVADALRERTGSESVLDAWAAEYGDYLSASDVGIDVEAVFRAYVDCALWSSTDDDGEPLDGLYGPDDISDESLERMREEVSDFCEECAADLAGIPDAQIGHDFWLTRNRHGAGFWDRDLGARGDRLTAAAHAAYGSSDLFVGDDGFVHVA